MVIFIDNPTGSVYTIEDGALIQYPMYADGTVDISEDNGTAVELAAWNSDSALVMRIVRAFPPEQLGPALGKMILYGGFAPEKF